MRLSILWRIMEIKENSLYDTKAECVVPKVIPPHPHHHHLAGNSSQASCSYLNFWAFENPPPPRNFQSRLWRKYGYFLELHNSIIVLLFIQSNSQFKKHSENMLTSIDVKFIFDSARLGLFSSANILQIADVALWVVFLLFLPCF